MINCVVDPLLDAVSESAASLEVVDSAVYLLNCLHQLHSTLSLLHTSSDKLEMIQVSSVVYPRDRRFLEFGREGLFFFY